MATNNKSPAKVSECMHVQRVALFAPPSTSSQEGNNAGINGCDVFDALAAEERIRYCKKLFAQRANLRTGKPKERSRERKREKGIRQKQVLAIILNLFYMTGPSILLLDRWLAMDVRSVCAVCILFRECISSLVLPHTTKGE